MSLCAWRLLGIWSCVITIACGGAQLPAAHGVPRLEPAPLLPPSAFVHDVQWRQRVSANWPTGKQTFDAVLQKNHGELILVGLSPLGLPGFVLHLHGDGAIDVENRTGRDLPFEPRYVLADVERVFFPWLPAPPASPPEFTGEREGRVGAVQVREQYARGQLAARSFERKTAQGTEHVRVAYSGWQPGLDAPTRATLDNDALHYTLTIETLEQTRLNEP